MAEARRFSFRDVIAGVSVALLLIPQSMAYAELAGLPPHVGLYAGALPPVAAALGYPEYASAPGLHLLCTPGGDVESTTGLAGAGATLQLERMAVGSGVWKQAATGAAGWDGKYQLRLAEAGGAPVALTAGDQLRLRSEGTTLAELIATA